MGRMSRMNKYIFMDVTVDIVDDNDCVSESMSEYVGHTMGDNMTSHNIPGHCIAPSLTGGQVNSVLCNSQ